MGSVRTGPTVAHSGPLCRRLGGGDDCAHPKPRAVQKEPLDEVGGFHGHPEECVVAKLVERQLSRHNRPRGAGYHFINQEEPHQRSNP